MKETPAEKRKRVAEIIDILQREYPGARTALNFNNPLELLVATILSAQCTDARVNEVTADLFRKYRTARDYAAADPAELENDIRPTGFFRNKAKNIIACCRAIEERCGGRVPQTMEELTGLAGVGRKTANVVLGNAFGVPALPVDTHVSRLAGRLGLTEHRDPVKIERDLMEVVPREHWTEFSHRLIYHGRAVCRARKPRCGECALRRLCPTGSMFFPR
ncbi:MAG: endonuclease III [Bacillota bacterium]|nr:endonuclease III [Bacillota bacterium]